MNTLGANVVIEFDGICRTYPGPPPVRALSEIDLTVRRGDHVSIVGPSGSGKSTFLNLVGLLDRPTAGRYLLDGIDTVDLDERDRTALRGRRIGFVFQSFHLLAHRTAAENAALALVHTGVPRAKRRRRALELLDRVGLADRARTRTGLLSGGERQRVAIARALAGEPSLLLCDEPTGNLDSANAATVLDLVDDLHSEGITILVVTHDSNVAARGERTVAIHDGLLHVMDPGQHHDGERTETH